MKLLEDTRAPLGSKRVRADALEVGEYVWTMSRGSAEVVAVVLTSDETWLRLKAPQGGRCPLFAVRPETRFRVLLKPLPSPMEEE